MAAAGQFVRERIPVPCSVPEAGRLVLELVGSSRDSIAETAGPMTFRVVRRYRPTWATALSFLVAPLFVRRTEACRIAVIEARIGAELLIEGDLDADLHESLLQLGRVPEAARVATLGPRPVPQVLASQLSPPPVHDASSYGPPNAQASYRPESAGAVPPVAGRMTPSAGVEAGTSAAARAAQDSPFPNPVPRESAVPLERMLPREEAIAGAMQRPSMPFQPLAPSARNGNGSGSLANGLSNGLPSGLSSALDSGPVARSGSSSTGSSGSGGSAGGSRDSGSQGSPSGSGAAGQPAGPSGSSGSGSVPVPGTPPAPPTAAMTTPLLQLEVSIDSGERSMVGPLLLIGRAPSRGENESHAKLLTVNDPSLSVSKTHLALGVDATGLWVVDRNSTNGTWIDDGRGELRPVEAGKRTQVPPGARVLVGERVLSFARLEG